MDIAEMMKKAQEMQSKMADMQSSMADIEATGSAGAGMVSVTLLGQGDLKSVTIDPALFSEDDKEVVEDLIVAAHADARKKLEAAVQEKMREVTGGLGLPGGFDLSKMKMPF